MGVDVNPTNQMIIHTWRGSNISSLKCIFTHIARCGGTTIEGLFLNGMDYWILNPNEKHIPAQVQKKLYAPYWDSYFKFAMIRNPFERFRSLWKYRDHYGLTLNDKGEIELDNWKKLWNYPKCIEYNTLAPVQLVNPEELDLKEGCLYQNMLHPDVRVFQLEYIDMVIRDLCNGFKLQLPQKPHMEKSMSDKPPLSEDAIKLIREVHYHDFGKYNYSKDYSN